MTDQPIVPNQPKRAQSDPKRAYRGYANRLGKLLEWIATHPETEFAYMRGEPFSTTEKALIRAIRLGWDGITEADAVQIIRTYLDDSAETISYHVSSFSHATLMEEIRKERERRGLEQG